MKKQNVIFIIAALATICVIGTALVCSMPYSVEEEPIWMPENYDLANVIHRGEYVPISGIYLGGCAVYISLEDYKASDFQENSVAVTRNKVYYYSYQTKGRNVTYIAVIDIGRRPVWTVFDKAEMKGVTDQGLILQCYYERNGMAVVFLSAVGVCCILVGVLIGSYIYEKRDC